MGDAQPTALRAIRDLGLPAETEQILVQIYEEVDRSYRDRFVDLTTAIREQSAQLNRIQETLRVLVEAIRPELAKTAPVAFSVAPADRAPDVATIKVDILDPIAANYTLSQRDVADALGLDQPEVSVLARAFNLRDDADCAMVVRKGKRTTVVNYHPRAVERFRELLRKPPSGLTDEATATLRRVRRKLSL